MATSEIIDAVLIKEAWSLPSDELIGLVREFIARNASCKLIVKGASMWPTILNGDQVTLSPLEETGIRLGEIVLAGNEKISSSSLRW